MSSRHGFELPCNPQGRSRLLQLPAEIRLTIYEHLLVSKKPVDPMTKSWNGDSATCKKCLNECHMQTLLSSQLLQCCQIMLKECHPLLYDSMELTIHCTEANLFILDAVIPLPDPYYDDADASLDTPLEELSVYAHEPWCFADEDFLSEGRQFWEIMAGLSKINRFNVVIREPPDTSVHQYVLYARALRGLLTTKIVRLSVGSESVNDHRRNSCRTDLSLHEPRANSRESNVLQTFKVWRCRSLTIYDTQCDQRTEDDLITTIIGIAPVYELIASYRRYATRTDDILRNLSAEQGQNLLSRLAEAAFSCNRKEYLKVKLVIRQAVEEAMARRLQVFLNDDSDIEEYPCDG